MERPRRVRIHRPGSFDRLRVEPMPLEPPPAGEVRVRARAAGVNYADCIVRMGLYSSAREYVGWPITPGFEVAGGAVCYGRPARVPSSFDVAWSALVSGVRLGRGRRVRFTARPPAQPLELWEFEACPFCRKVREVLCELDLEYVCHPVARGSAHRSETPTYAGGRKSYPYLVDPNTGAAMKESEDIIDYLLSEYGPGAGARSRRLAPIHTLGSFVASAIRPRGRAVRAGLSGRAPPSEPLLLYSFESCPYCRRVRERLHALDLVHVVKNAAKGSARRAELVAIGGRAKVPFLIDPNTGTQLYESSAICDYLEATYGAPHPSHRG